MNPRSKETLEEKISREKAQQLIDNRKKRFTDLLGEDCGYIDALVVRTDISPWDVEYLLQRKCPHDLIPKILL